MIPSKEENPEGLYFRYIVTKVDGTPIDPSAEYFILRLDEGGSDPQHLNACKKAVLAYAEAIAPYIPKLAEDLINRYSEKDV